MSVSLPLLTQGQIVLTVTAAKTSHLRPDKRVIRPRHFPLNPAFLVGSLIISHSRPDKVTSAVQIVPLGQVGEVLAGRFDGVIGIEISCFTTTMLRQ